MSDEKYTSSLSLEEQEKRAERTRERQVKALAGLSVGGSGGAEADGAENNNNDDGPAGSGVAEAEAFLQGETGLSTDAADLAPFEEKWGFSFTDLQSAVRVVSTLFSNPSLYVGDPYLAESRLYTMITRDRRTKKEHRDSFKQIMNEEKRRRDKMKRAQDLETIKKTTMKREREDALNQLLLAVNADADEDDVDDGRGGRAQQLLLQQHQQRGTTSTSTAQLALTSSLSTPINSGEQNMALILEGNDAGTSSVVEVAQQRLSNKRGLAAFELMETVYNPASLAVDCLTIHDVTLDLCPQAVQEWRCFLTAAYHRFMPTLPFGTQMVHCLPTSDYFGQKSELIPASSQHCHAVLHASQRLLLGLRVFATEATTTAPSQAVVPSLGTAMIKETECILHLSLSLKELLLPARQYRTSEAGVPPMGVPAATVNEIFTSWKVHGGNGDNGDSVSSCIFARSAHASSHFARSAQRLSANNGSILSRLVGADLSTSDILRGSKPLPIKPITPATVILSATSLRHAMITGIKEEEATSLPLPTPPPHPADVSLITLLQAVRLQCEYLLDPSSSSILTAHGTEASAIVSHVHRSLSEFITAVTTTTLQLSGEVIGNVLMGLLSLLAVVTRSHAQAREDASTCELDDVSVNTVGINEVILSPTAFKAAYTQPLRFCNKSSSSSQPAISSIYGGLLLSSSSTIVEEEDGHHPSPSPSTPVVTLQRLSDTVAAVMALVLYTADTDNCITRSITHLFGELWFDLPKVPEALPDGTILREEGFFETDRFVPLSMYEQDEQFPYQDAMVFVTSNNNNTQQQQQHEKKGGTMMMLTKETSEELRMNRVQKCHTCKGKYSFLHPFYYSLCRPCGEFNYHKRLMTRDLTGKVVLLTGCRIKIGFAMALSLLRCGATVIGTTRFSVDAMGRFSEEPDYDIWKHRLHLYTIDLRDMWLVTEFCAYIGSKFPKLFGIINNAAQTIARTPAYTAELRRLEAQPPAMLRARLDKDADATAWYHYYHSNSSVIVGRSLTLEHHPVTNPVLHDDLSLEANAAASSSSSTVTESKVDRDTRLKKAGGDDGALTSHLKGDALGKAVAQRYDRYDTYAEESDKREHNTWTTNMADVEGSEAAEVMAINALSPFILNAKLKPLLMNRAGEEPEADNNEEPEVISHSARKAGAHHIGKYPSSGRFIINVSAMEGQFYRHKQTTHPHTNMAKAALNMMTRTSAEDYAKDGIYMNSVDTGWITDESPAEKKKHRAQESMLCPLDEVDAAARCLDLIYTDSREYGKFYKNFVTISW